MFVTIGIEITLFGCGLCLLQALEGMPESLKGTAPGILFYIFNAVIMLGVALIGRGVPQEHPASRAGAMDIARGKAYHFRDDWNATWKEYITDLRSFIGKSPRGSIPFRQAWSLGFLMEKILNPLQVRAPLTRLNAGVLGRNNDVDTTLARTDLGWRTTLSYDEAMEKIGAWVKETYGGRP